MVKKDKKKIQWGQWIMVIGFTLLGGICGVLIAEYIDRSVSSGKSAGETIFTVILLFVGMYVSMFLQIVIHEAGHLLFGLLSGYQFSSFRIGSFMWINKIGKLEFKRMSLAGTGGQCLMNPPELVNGKMPYVLYNLGGSILNIISSLIFIGFLLILQNSNVLKILLSMLAVIGVAFALMNGVPMRMGAVDNDGYNARSLGKDKEALRSFWVQMRVSNEQIYGHRLKDMPKEWFEIPSDEEMKNSMSAVLGVFACNRLMDEKRFEEADRLMEHFMEIKTGIVGVHRCLMLCDRIYSGLLRGDESDEIEKMLDKQQKKFMKSMKTFPSVLRTEYVIALLLEKDTVKADKIKRQFEKIAQTYPYISDIESERELMGLAEAL